MSTEDTIDKVQHDHERRRLECRTLPKVRRGKRPRRRPNMALVSYAALVKMIDRIPNGRELVRRVLAEKKSKV
jgi:hypothetical protein